MSLIEIIQKCLDENGIVVYDNGTFEQINSINYISAIIDIEKELNIEFPDEYLIQGLMSNFQHLLDVVEIMVTKQENEKIQEKGGE